MSKKNIGIVLIVIATTIFIVIIGLVLSGKNTPDSFKNSETLITTINTEIYNTPNIRIENMDSLYFYRDDEYKSFKDKLSGYLQANNFSNVKVADIVGSVETQDSIIYKFWLYISLYDTVLRCEYNIDTDSVNFYPEEDIEILNNLLGVDSPTSDGDPGIADASTKVIIDNINILNSYMSQGDTEMFKDELETYLISLPEYRRSFVIKEDTITNTDDFIKFICIFNSKNPVNDYNISVTFYKFGSWDFSTASAASTNTE